MPAFVIRHPLPVVVGLLAAAAGAPPAMATSPAEIAAALERADDLAAHARALEDDARVRAVAHALAAYDAVLALRPGDRILDARIHRRRAKLLAYVGRIHDAVTQYRAIAEGRGRRKDRARALYEIAKLQQRAGDLPAAERALREAIDRYRSVEGTYAKVLLRLGKVAKEGGRFEDAARAWMTLVDDVRESEKTVIEGYDRLALLAVDRGDLETARRWLRRCFARYRRRAERDDRRGAFLARQLGGMRAPERLAEAEAEAAADGGGDGAGERRAGGRGS